MKWIITLFIALFFSLSIFAQANLTKIAQIDIYIQDSALQVQVTKIPRIKTDEDVFELIFTLYVLEHTNLEISKKLQEIRQSGLIAKKPEEKLPAPMKL